MDDRNPRRARPIAGIALLVLLVASAAQVWAQSSASYQIPRQSIDAGGGRSASPSFELVAVSGQPEAAAAMSSPSYTLRGGLLRAAELAPSGDPIFASGFEP